MNFIWSISWIFSLFSFIIQLSSSQFQGFKSTIDQTHDSEIRSYRYRVPPYCHNSYETIECYDTCKDHESVSVVYDNIRSEEDQELSSLQIAQFALQIDKIDRDSSIKSMSSEVSSGRGIPCRNKCETDPIYWSCIQQCDSDDHTTLWKSHCFVKDKETGRLNCDVSGMDFLLEPGCKRCIVNATRIRLKHSCGIAYLPGFTLEENLCEIMSTCNTVEDPHNNPAEDINAVINDCANIIKDNVELLRNCVNDKIMIVQRECCYSEVIRNATGCREDNEKCDEYCMKILSPSLCREKCHLYKTSSIETCVENVCNLYHTINESFCGHCNQTDPANADFIRDWKCVEGCDDASTECIKACLPYGSSGGSGTIPQYLIDNCHNEEYIANFSSYVMENRRKHYWPISISDTQPRGSNWMSHYRLPFECGDGMCTTVRETAPLTTIEFRELCLGNPFRAIDLLACAIIQPHPVLNTLNQKLIGQNSHFSDCRRDPELEITQVALYKLIFNYENETVCARRYCNTTESMPEDRDLIFHPNAFANMKCQIFECQKAGQSPFCKPEVDSQVVNLEDYGVCWWKADLSKWDSPSRLWSTYFNELHPAEIKHKLEQPDSTHTLMKSLFAGKSAFYSFPYFIILRSMCVEGYYSEENYRDITLGNTPVVELKYTVPTNRHWPKNIFQGVFKTALIDLERFDEEDENLVPENPRRKTIRTGDGDAVQEIGCIEGICYPAYAAPLMFINVPLFKVLVLDQGVVNVLSQTIYVSQFHTRVAAGRGEIYDPGERNVELGVAHSETKVPAHPGKLFPKERSTFAVDKELNYHQKCIAKDVTDKTSEEYNEQKCPELDHILDDFDNPYEENWFAPLDAEDIFRSQYTYGTAPTQAVAGFFDPKYIIIGDADMEQVHVVDWSKLLTKLEANRSLISCIQQEFQHREHVKPIYSQLDRTDVTYPHKYYRLRYKSKAYHTAESSEENSKYADTAIFEAIGLEDRLLLITSKGLVSFYGHSNSTVHKDKTWMYNEKETLNKCFKIVRILPAAQPNSDIIIGITYNYVVRNTRRALDPHEFLQDPDDEKSKALEDVSQEIWIGKFVEAGEEIKWKQLKAKPKESLYLDYPVGANQNEKGEYVTLKPDKDPGLSHSMREANPGSKIDEVCYKAFRTQIDSYELSRGKVRLVDEVGWCSAMDATPIPLKENAIQVLVRMRTYFNKDDSTIYFYIVATHAFDSSSAAAEWQIDSIIPRYPCVDQHREAVKNIFVYNGRYFEQQFQGTDLVDGCHETNVDRLDFHIFLHGMTYSRTFSNTLFVYGSRLLQSSNNGRSFMFLKGFPQRFQEFVGSDLNAPGFGNAGNDAGNPNPQPIIIDRKKNRPVHRIVKMAFDDGGHYAFLTNKRELWMGSTGSSKHIRIRPSPLQSMSQLGVSKIRNIHSGVPFTIDFDSNNQLYEMVAIIGEGGHATKVMKRLVKEWTLLKVQTILDKMRALSESMYETRKKENTWTDVLQKPYRYDTAKWSTICLYSNPSLRQNFSRTNSRAQGTYLSHPEQHLIWGRAHREASLLAFQAITFSLIWESYFTSPQRFYAGQDRDPYISWVTNRRFAAFSVMKQALFSQETPPEEHSILIQPLKYKRIILTKLHSDILRNYYIDLNITAELKLEFFIRNDHAVLNPEFVEDQISNVELNVENANGSIIQINTEREAQAHKASVLFIIRISIKKNSGIKQHLPGHNIVPVPVTYHLIGAFGNCIADDRNGIIGDKIETIAYVGCPPNRDFVFDWNATLRSIKLRGDRIQSNKVAHGIGGDCYGSEYVCIYARSPATFHFEIYDESKHQHLPYTGKYIMRIIGGGRKRDSIRLYTPEEIDAFNIVGISDASLIWNEWDPVLHQKVDRKSDRYFDSEDGEMIGKDSRENILTSGVSVITWVCHTLSPCARITPTKDFEVVFWFRVLITNRDVDTDTLCLYEKEFDMMLYGFPPSPEYQLFATLGFSCLFLSVLYLFYLCCRQDARLWVSTKIGAKNWYFIIKDAIPKKLRYYELPLQDEVEKHGKPKRFYTAGFEDTSQGNSFSSFEISSADNNSSVQDLTDNSSSTIEITTNVGSSQILPTTGRLHSTAKQILYDQILTRRLNTIVEKNRALRSNLIKKASIHQSREDLEQETNFQRQFGRTVSQESVFTPPMPKDKKRGIDSFL